MPIKIKDIPNALITKEPIDPDSYGGNYDREMGFNEAIDQQGEVDIGLNRERLAKLLFEKSSVLVEMGCIWSRQGPTTKEKYYILADAIIAAESTLLEVKK